MLSLVESNIYGLFSIANLYDQPDNNLVVLWDHLPPFQEVTEVISIEEREYKEMLQGKSIRVRFSCTDYRLQQVIFGKPLPEQ